MASYVLSGSVEVSPELAGALRVGRANTYTPEERKDLLGYRPSLPLLVNSMSVVNLASIASANVSVNGHFVMSASFTGGPGDPLYDQGAKPGSIGTKTLQGVTTIYVFREPYQHEVVWHVAIDINGDPDERGFYRWRDDLWSAYKSWPERAVGGQYAFEVLDPDKIYDYYAKLLGATMGQWMVDTRSMVDFIDPDRCPADVLHYLAQNFGLVLDASEQEEVQRSKLRDAIPTYKEKGLARAVVIRLRSLGYIGYPREIWVNPDNPANYTDDTTGEKGNDWIEVIHGSRYREPRVGLLFVGAEQPFDGETVIVDDYTTQVTFEFDSGGGVGGGNTPVTIGADAFETRDNLIAAIDASALDMDALPTALTDWPELTVTSGKVSSTCAILHLFNHYFPSSRISLHINRIGGQPLSMTTPAAALLEFKEFIARQLGEDVVPAQVDIRFFATDLEVGPSGFDIGEEVEVDDELVLVERVPSSTDYQPTATGSPTAGHYWDASSEWTPSAGAWPAADDNTGTFWQSDTSGLPEWWEYEPDVDKVFVKMSIRAFASTTAPKDFTIEGYDGVSWHILKTVVGETGWSFGESRDFLLSNGTAYQKYRINITANNGAAATAFSETEWFDLA